jgi:hypothetical protein
MSDSPVDALMKPKANPRILRGGPYGDNGAWTVDVEYTKADGTREVVTLTRAQLTEWRDRK